MLKIRLKDGTEIEVDTPAEALEVIKLIHSEPVKPVAVPNGHGRCVDCGVDLVSSRTVRCAECRVRRQRSYSRNYKNRMAGKTEERIEAAPSTITCVDCGGSVERYSRFGPARKRCEKCSAAKMKQNTRESMRRSRSGPPRPTENPAPVPLISRDEMETDEALARIRRAARRKEC